MYTRQLNDRIEDKQPMLVFFIRWNEPVRLCPPIKYPDALFLFTLLDLKYAYSATPIITVKNIIIDKTLKAKSLLFNDVNQ